MVISPNDFSLWSRLTGNKYPSTPRERAQKGPEVQNFIQNLGKEGMLGGKEAEEPKKENNLGKKIATGALIAGGIAAGVAAGRDKRVQDIAQRAAATTRTKIDDFLVNLGPAQKVDVDIVDASGDVTPNPRQQQSNVAPQLKSGSESIKSGGLGSRIVGPLPDVSIEDSVDFDIARSPDDPTYGAYGEDVQLGNVKDIMREQEQLSAFTGETSPGIDPVSGVSYEDIKQKLQNTAATRGVKSETVKQLPAGPGLIERVEQKKAAMANTFKPAIQGETFQTSGAVSKDDTYSDIGDATLRARRTFKPTLDALKEIDPSRKDIGRMGRQMLNQAQQDRDFDIAYIDARNKGLDDTSAVKLARETAGFDGTAAVRKPTEYRKLLGTLESSSPLKPKVDDLLNLVKTGPIIKLPEGVQEGGALVQISAGNITPDNKAIKAGATVGGPTLTDQHATEMAVDNVLDNARNAYENQVSTIVEAGRTGSGSITTRGAAERFLQKTRPDVVKNLETAIEQDLTQTTGLNPEDAANIAESVINPTTGERQFNTDQFGDTGAVKRNLKDLKSVPNIDPDTRQGTMKTAVGTAIRGRAPSYYEALPKTDTRELPGPFEEIVPDRRTATRGGFGAALQQSIEEEGVSPAKMPEGGSAGIGIYGEGTGYLPGPFSSTAKTKPTDAPGKTSPFKGVSDSTLEKIKSDMKPGTKTFKSVEGEQRGRASIDIGRQLRQIQTTGNPETVGERTTAFFDKLDPTGELRKRNLGK